MMTERVLQTDSEFRFSKVLAKYYIKWYQDCCDSIIYCNERGDSVRAAQYLADSHKYLTIIMENWDAIEFFSQGDNAFMVDRVLPEQFRGYR